CRDVESLSSDAPGANEVNTLPWPLLLRAQITARVEASERYPWLVLATVLFGLFSVGCTITILAVSIPRIATDLSSDTSTVSWVTTGPILAFAVFGPAAGKLADLRGQRGVYLLSLVGVGIFAALSAVAWSAGALIAFRVLGAATGAATGPASLAIINRMFPPAKRAQAMGYWAMVGAGGPVVGALVGGPVVEAFGWRWLFVAQVPLTVATLLVAAAVLPNVRPSPEARAARFDGWGAVTLGAAAVSLLLAVNRGSRIGWTQPLVVAGFVVTPLLITAFVLIERRVAHPLLPLHYLRRRNFTFPIATQFFTNFAYMGAFAITPLLLQEEYGFGETRTTLLSIPRPLVFAIAGPVAGYFTLKIGERVAGVTGAVSIVASMVALSTLAPGDGTLPIIFALGLSGLGMGTASPALAAAIANSVDENDLGVAGATQQMVSQVGTAMGTQVLLAVQTARESSVGAVGSYGEAFLVGGGMAVIGLGLATFVRRTPRAPGRATGAPQGARNEPAEAGRTALAAATR
ncbi:MAG: MFS transporter, partial [Acidimicrobiia bacterium]|nr:MFS transporter [Acidimicrobiia bacterium]